jgi:hypothetical protein
LAWRYGDVPLAPTVLHHDRLTDNREPLPNDPCDHIGVLRRQWRRTGSASPDTPGAIARSRGRPRRLTKSMLAQVADRMRVHRATPFDLRRCDDAIEVEHGLAPGKMAANSSR